MNQANFLPNILIEAAILFFILMVLGLGAATFLHANAGRPLDRNYSLPTDSGKIVMREVPIAQGETISKNISGAEGDLETAAAEVLPPYVFLKVPFSSQAPWGDWSEPFQGACEETSVLMSIAWARNWELDPEIANREILAQVAFEDKNFGYSYDTSLADTLKIFTEYYNYDKVKVVYGIEPGDIKRELARGNLVILPLAGKLLGNPYFRAAPKYHMLVVRGYDDVAQKFITNEPGTAMGEGYGYSYETLYNAVHDWPGVNQDIMTGEKRMIVVSKGSEKQSF